MLQARLAAAESQVTTLTSRVTTLETSLHETLALVGALSRQVERGVPPKSARKLEPISG